MAQNWFVTLDGKEHGPLSSSQLKQLAGQGKVSPDTDVRQGSSGKWVPAAKVKGLFETSKHEHGESAVRDDDILDRDVTPGDRPPGQSSQQRAEPASQSDSDTASVPPPLPDRRPSGAVTPDPVTAPAHSAASAGSNLKEKLKTAYRWVNKRVVALKLKHDIKSLRAAIDEQHERLGMVAIQQRPVGLEIEAETGELERIQAELIEKQEALDSLRGTKGSGVAVRDVKREIAEGQKRQRALKIGIGGKADRARPEIPEAQGHYQAIEQLRATLQTKENELAAIEPEFDPIAQGSTPSRPTFAKPLILTGAGMAALLLLVLLLSGWGDSYDNVMRDQIDNWRQLNEVLSDVKDEKSAKAAARKIERIAEKMVKLKERADKLGDPSEETMKELKEKYEKEFEEVGDDFVDNKWRIDRDRKLSKPLESAWEKLDVFWSGPR